MFIITHGFGVDPLVVMVGKAIDNLPDIDYWTANTMDVEVWFKDPPADGTTIKLWWLVIRPVP